MNWPKDIREAKEIQLGLREDVRILPLRKKIKYVAGVDAAFSEDNVIATACLYAYPQLIQVGDAYAFTKVLFPYIPGFLSFREGPAIIEAINRLNIKPDIVLFDGQGMHTQRASVLPRISGFSSICPPLAVQNQDWSESTQSPGLKKESILT